MPKFFSHLRDATQQSHRALESVPPFSQFMQPDFHEGDYIHVLQVMSTFHETLEKKLPSADQFTFLSFLEMNRVCAALNVDLADSKPSALQLPWSPILQEAAPEILALAAGYVWMGSSMGGRIIEKWLSRHHPTLPRAYYSTMISLGDQWPHFKDAVEDYLDNHPVDVSTVSDVANALFEVILQCAQNNKSIPSPVPCNA